jgi:FkbM family methyltransferase
VARNGKSEEEESEHFEMRSKTLIGVLTGAYSIVRKTRLFQIPLLRRALLAASFCYKHWYEDPFWKLMQRTPELLANGDVLDIGANIGYTAWVFAQGIAQDAKVYAFEPDLNSFGSLEELIQRKGLQDRVKPLNIAIGSQEGELEFWHNKNHSADHRIVTEEFRKALPENERIVRVPVTTVDKFVEIQKIERLSFIKIDVQGYELAVCHGMSKTLERFPRLMVCLEFAPEGMHDLGFEPGDVLQFFLSRGYKMSVVTRQATVPVSDGDAIRRMMGRAEYVDLLFRHEV